MLKKEDSIQIANHGLDENVVLQQIEHFKSGFSPSNLIKPVLEGDGLNVLNAGAIQDAISKYNSAKQSKSIVKFVPASGAATRMFKTLYAFLENYQGSPKEKENLDNDDSRSSMGYFFKHIDAFAFYKELEEALAKSGGSIGERISTGNYKEVVKGLIDQSGLDYGQLPKGLLKFHNYEDSARTPVEEHMAEGCQYAVDGKKEVNIHLTVSAEHQERFEKHVSNVKSRFESEFDVKINVTYSQQKPSTDTIAVDLDNEPFRNQDGSLLFRPAGHGALLENLNDVDADLIFLKNIDNIVPDKIKSETVKYKKVIAGVLLDAQEKAFNYCQLLAEDIDQEKIDEINQFISSKLGYAADRPLTAEQAKSILNRPIRVCGMVKSEGDPGGGPFWVNDGKATSLQVVETAQVDLNDDGQKEVFKQSTHFNPVDVVCGVRDYKSEKFNLLDFRDPATGFITAKSKDGKDLKAQELPGLWNGSMAHWNTIFVEVPLVTFNPVKSVNDLLLSEHQ